jgi:Tfp pilus assembly protein PilV
MSTVAEIESAIGKLPADELRRLLDRLLAKSTNGFTKPKTGAELAKLWPARFHLQTSEAEALAADLAETRAQQPAVRPSAWE